MGKKDSKTPAKPSTAPSGGSPTSGATQQCHKNCKIESKTFATSPADRKRKKVGVGEEVIIVSTGNDATWTKSGGGTLDPASGVQSSVAFTAGDKAESVTITAKHSGCGCSNSITYTVVEPASWTMKRQTGTDLKHTKGWPDCGFLGIMYVHPNDVNFYRIETREKDSKSVATGSYNPTHHDKFHGNYGPPDNASSWFPIVDHTDADGSTDNAPDQIYSGFPGTGKTGTKPPFNVGDMFFPITIEWRVLGETAIHSFPIVRQEHEIFSDGKCDSRKAHDEFCKWDDPTSSW